MNEFPILLYTTPEGGVKVNAVLKDESLWLSQAAMVELFDVDKSTISRHIKNIFAEGELDEKVVVAKIATTTRHGAISDKMQEHAESVKAFLTFGKYKILTGRGLISRDAADARAAEEYDAYNRQLKFESDFDREIKRFLSGEGPKAIEVK